MIHPDLRSSPKLDAVLHTALQTDGDVKKAADDLFNTLHFDAEFVGKPQYEQDHAKVQLCGRCKALGST